MRHASFILLLPVSELEPLLRNVGRLSPLPKFVKTGVSTSAVSPAPRSAPAPPPPVRSEDERLERLAADARRDLKRYRDTLGPVLVLQENELERQKRLYAAREDLYRKGAMSESELRAGRRAVDAAQKDVDDSRRAIAEADRMMKEVEDLDRERQEQQRR